MKWSHLPGSGLLYDQDPLLLDHFRTIWAERAAEQERKSREQDRKNKRGPSPRVAGRR